MMSTEHTGKPKPKIALQRSARGARYRTPPHLLAIAALLLGLPMLVACGRAAAPRDLMHSPLGVTGTPSLTSTRAPAPPASLTPVTQPVPVHAVWVHLSETSSPRYAVEKDVGTTAHLVAGFEPTLFTRMGSALSYVPWQGHDVAEMQVCFSLDAPCDPAGRWQAFAGSQEASFPVDWLGSRQVWVAAQFRDTEGNVVPGLGDGDQVPSSPVQISQEIVGVVNQATPIAQQPPFVQTAIAATQVAFPVEGSVEIEGGRCCAGGEAGHEIPLDVTFEARCSYGPVTEMRIGRGSGCNVRQDELLEEMATLPWEPFVAHKTYTTVLAINWVGWYISVQYRDESGHLSAVYCDDISLEGMPPQPTATPSPY